MPKVYLFSVDGKITPISFSSGTTSSDITPSLLGKEYQNEQSLYVEYLPDNFNLMMHKVNSSRKGYKKSSLEVNQALRKYFPNSPFKGNVLLIRLDYKKRIIKGSCSMLKKFTLGYLYGSTINNPLIISRNDALKITEYPDPPDSSQEDILNETRKDIEKVKEFLDVNPEIDTYLKEHFGKIIKFENVSWEQFIEFSNLRKAGLNTISLRWLNTYLNRLISYETLEKKIGLFGIVSLLYCFDRNSKFDFDAEECPDCREFGEYEECERTRRKMFRATAKVLSDFGYKYISRFKRMGKTVLPHVTLHIFNQFFHQLNDCIGMKSSEKRHVVRVVFEMIFNWADLVVDEYEINEIADQ